MWGLKNLLILTVFELQYAVILECVLRCDFFFITFEVLVTCIICVNPSIQVANTVFRFRRLQSLRFFETKFDYWSQRFVAPLLIEHISPFLLHFEPHLSPFFFFLDALNLLLFIFLILLIELHDFL